ncbi:hypothetical protein I350_05949 [Cryptococcus amylolentus CBS 6273]|uniref:BTB domain-containing protein n=1 Tax=Cryptococcus amylolentus CBS 6273 TaxID=1296118 RepID=A0A1E3JQG9_9TREE|nr:hypothetical protein I350_05949 [Cryptococcus amylolentus CBS 6273]
MIYARAPRTLRVERLKVNDQPGFEARVGDRLSNTTSVTDLIFCGSPELLKIYVKWMYTAQGCEVVAEWAARESPSETQELIDIMQDSQSLGEDRLRQDLIYMWRSKLYADVQIHVSAPAGTCRTPPTPLTSPAPSPSAALAIYLPSPESDMTFTAHSFILASRSPYMATEINRIAHPSIPTINLTLPSESFTMAALYFCLGYIYTGSLLFSNRAIDLGTALQIYDSASILGLAELCRELQSRIVYDFCHGLDWDLCHCGRCLAHALELWAHTLHTDMGQLAVCTSTFILSGWAVFWEESQAQTPKRSQRMIILLEDIRVSLEAGILPRISQGFHELLAMVNESDLFQVEEGHDFIPGLTRLQAAKSLCAKALVILAEQELQELDRMRGQSLARRTIESMLGQAISCLLYGQAPVHEALYQRTALTPDSIGSDTSRSQLLRSAVKERFEDPGSEFVDQSSTGTHSRAIKVSSTCLPDFQLLLA